MARAVRGGAVGGVYVVNGGVIAVGAVSGPQGGYLVAVDIGEVGGIISNRNAVRTFILPRR